MDCKYLIVSSITYAMKAREELNSRGIYCKIEKIKNIPKLNGCGYGVKVSNNDTSIAVRYLNISGLKIIDILDFEVKSR